MKIQLITLGKTSQTFVEEGVEMYSKRINKYYNFNIECINTSKIKANKAREVKVAEAKLLGPHFIKGGFSILLDENGKSIDSEIFAKQLEKWMSAGFTPIQFFVGGAFGFDTSIYEKANFKLALSPMTFSHQLIRLIFAEQLYRAISIVHHLPYHNP